MVISILTVWQQMCLANRALITFADIIMTMLYTALYIHVLIEHIFSTSVLHYILIIIFKQLFIIL